MKILESGHVYVLEQIEPKGEMLPQIVRFIKRSSNVVTHPYEQEGTITQEILRVAIDRTKYLNSLQPCEENEDCLFHLRHALLCYEARAWRLKQEKVNNGQGKHQSGPERFKDIPFGIANYVEPDPYPKVYIEDLPIGSDGHILVEEE